MVMTTYNPQFTPYEFACFRDDMNVNSLIPPRDVEEGKDPEPEKTFAEYYRYHHTVDCTVYHITRLSQIPPVTSRQSPNLYLMQQRQ